MKSEINFLKELKNKIVQIHIEDGEDMRAKLQPAIKEINERLEKLHEEDEENIASHKSYYADIKEGANYGVLIYRIQRFLKEYQFGSENINQNRRVIFYGEIGEEIMDKIGEKLRTCLDGIECKYEKRSEGEDKIVIKQNCLVNRTKNAFMLDNDGMQEESIRLMQEPATHKITIYLSKLESDDSSITHKMYSND